MVRNGEGKDHETTFVPHVHPTTLGDLDLEAGYQGDKQSDKDKGARLKKVLLGGVFCAVLLVCCGAIWFFRTQEQSCSSSIFLQLLDLLFGGNHVEKEAAEPRRTRLWDQVEPPNIRFPCSVNSETWYHVYLDPKSLPFNAGAFGCIFKAQIRESNGGNRWKRGSYVIVKVPISANRGHNAMQVVNQSLEANRRFAKMAAKPHSSEERVQGGSVLNDFGKHFMKVYGIADLDQSNLRTLKGRISHYRKTKNQHSAFEISEKVVVAEYCEYGSLSSYLKERVRSTRGQRGAKLELAEIGRVAEHICCALQLLHLNQMAHRDVKPDNILVRRVAGGPPTFVLGDPDLLELKGPSYWKIAGTPAYMPNHLGALKFDGTPCHSARQDWYGLLCSVLHCAVPALSADDCMVQRERVYCRNNYLGNTLLDAVRKSGHEIINANLPQAYCDSDAYMEKYLSTPLRDRPRTVLDEFENLLSENMTGGHGWSDWVDEVFFGKHTDYFSGAAKKWCRRTRFFLAQGILTQECQGRVLPRGPTFDDPNPGPSIRRRVREMMSGPSKPRVEAVPSASKHGFDQEHSFVAPPEPPSSGRASPQSLPSGGHDHNRGNMPYGSSLPVSASQNALLPASTSAVSCRPTPPPPPAVTWGFPVQHSARAMLQAPLLPAAGAPASGMVHVQGVPMRLPQPSYHPVQYSIHGGYR